MVELSVHTKLKPPKHTNSELKETKEECRQSKGTQSGPGGVPRPHQRKDCGPEETDVLTRSRLHSYPSTITKESSGTGSTSASGYGSESGGTAERDGGGVHGEGRSRGGMSTHVHTGPHAWGRDGSGRGVRTTPLDVPGPCRYPHS